MCSLEEAYKMDASAMAAYLADPATLITLGIVAAGTLYYMYTMRSNTGQPLPASQCHELPGGVKGNLSVGNGEMIKHVYDDAKTLYETFQRGKRLSNDGPCLGTRTSATGPYQWVSYSEVEERSVSFGAGLCKLGIAPGQSSFIGVYGPNCVEWVIAEQSCNAYSRVVVPLYDTLGREAVIHIINEANISCVVCNSKKVPNLVTLKESCPQLSTVIVFEDNNDVITDDTNIKLYTMKQIEEEGRNNPVDIQPGQPNDLVTICYTSGTTGLPKGVMITNENMICNASGMLNVFDKLHPSDCHISYMPLAHMMERTAQAIIFMSGARVGFFRGDIKTLVNDIQELKPTIFVSVPRLLNRLYDKTLTAVKGSKVKKWLYETAFQSKLADVKKGIVRKNTWWDTVIFKKIQLMLGGQVRVIISGSAPIGDSVMDFLRVAFGCQVYEGYGQTEATTGLTLTLPNDTTTGHVGAPLSCAQIKLRDVPEMNYYAANGEGEVCFKGPCVTKGYYKNPVKTAELFDEDGWARSGDVGKWLPNGTLKIIDRVKHIFKLSQGEYIAPEKVENICARSSYVGQIFLFGDSLKSCCVAIVVPDEEVLLNWARSYGRGDVPFEELCKDKTVYHVIMEDLKETAKNGGLNPLEIPKAIKLCSELFTVDNELLTPTFKLKRNVIRDSFMEDIDLLYSELTNY